MKIKTIFSVFVDYEGEIILKITKPKSWRGFGTRWLTFTVTMLKQSSYERHKNTEVGCLRVSVVTKEWEWKEQKDREFISEWVKILMFSP